MELLAGVVGKVEEIATKSGGVGYIFTALTTQGNKSAFGKEKTAWNIGDKVLISKDGAYYSFIERNEDMKKSMKELSTEQKEVNSWFV